jgi:hypothetical protein
MITDQKHPENVEYFNYVGVLIKVMPDVKENLNSGLPWLKQNSTHKKQ